MGILKVFFVYMIGNAYHIIPLLNIRLYERPLRPPKEVRGGVLKVSQMLIRVFNLVSFILNRLWPFVMVFTLIHF